MYIYMLKLDPQVRSSGGGKLLLIEAEHDSTYKSV